MSSDIYTIIEIKKNDVWEYIDEIVPEFDERSYGVFSILNRNIRNHLGIDGFNAKGLPSDVSGETFRFVSQRHILESQYETQSFLRCVTKGEHPSIIDPYDPTLTVKISEEKYKEISEDLKENFSNAYFMPYRLNDGTFAVQSAEKVNGEFKYCRASELFCDIDEMNKVCYGFNWVEKEQDYGYYEVDFRSNATFGHSYLTLKELRTKVRQPDERQVYYADKRLIEKFIYAIGYVPEGIVLKDINEKEKSVEFVEDEELHLVMERYADGVKNLEKIKEKYDITNDEDIRIVFGFDS